MKKIVCKICNKEFKGTNHKYCSRECRLKNKSIINKLVPLKDRRKYDRIMYEKHKKSKKAKSLKYNKLNKNKIKVWNKLNYEKRKDKTKLIKCSICDGTNNLIKHHEDYSKGFEFIVLCKKCHNQLHHSKY